MATRGHKSASRYTKRSQLQFSNAFLTLRWWFWHWLLRSEKPPFMKMYSFLPSPLSFLLSPPVACQVTWSLAPPAGGVAPCWGNIDIMKNLRMWLTHYKVIRNLQSKSREMEKIRLSKEKWTDITYSFWNVFTLKYRATYSLQNNIVHKQHAVAKATFHVCNKYGATRLPHSH